MSFTGTCNPKTDRDPVALGFVPHTNLTISLKYLDNLIACGLPCFNGNGTGKSWPDHLTLDDSGLCCHCCEANNTMYEEQFFSSNDCGCCIEGFIKKMFRVQNLYQCFLSKNKEVNIPMPSVESYAIDYECYQCIENDFGMQRSISIYYI